MEFLESFICHLRIFSRFFFMTNSEMKFIYFILACDQKPILLILPNIKEQTESKNKLKTYPDHRKKSLIDSGIELLFKKSNKIIKDGHHTDLKIRPEVVLDNHHHQSNANHHLNNHHHYQTVSASSSPKHHHHHHNNHTHLHPDEKKWRPFESIKIYTDRRKSHDGGDRRRRN